jgi:hypothetical protein
MALDGGRDRVTTSRPDPPGVTPSLSALPRGAGSASWVSRSLPVLAGGTAIAKIAAPGSVDPSAGPRGLPGSDSRRRLAPAAEALSESRPLQGPTIVHRRATPRTPARDARACAVPPLGFRPLRRIQRAESTWLSRVCLARYVPPPGSRTLLTGCSSARPPGLFHPGGAHGVRPPEPCSRPQSRDASRRPVPS